MEEHFHTQFKKHRYPTRYVSLDKTIALVCTVSHRYEKTTYNYWFKISSPHKHFLDSFSRSYAVFGCGDSSQILLFPYAELTRWLEKTGKSDGRDTCWHHVQFLIESNKKVSSILEGHNQRIDVTNYLL